MKYIRFLKPPRIEGRQLKAVITITSDLGDELLAEDVELHACLYSGGAEPTVRISQGITWETYSRAIPIVLNIDKAKPSWWPARLYVGVGRRPDPDALVDIRDAGRYHGILSAFSSTLDPRNGMSCADKLVERRFVSTSGNLNVWEETGESIARHVWDAGVTLAAHIQDPDSLRRCGLQKFLASKPNRPLSVIELGCGTGVVGISIAKYHQNAEVILTDLGQAQAIVTRNLSANEGSHSSNIIFMQLDWEDPLPSRVQDRADAFDVVIFADCTYNADSSPFLVKTLVRILERSPSAVIIAAMKVRHASEIVFFELMKTAGLLQVGHAKLEVAPGVGEWIETYVFGGEAHR